MQSRRIRPLLFLSALVLAAGCAGGSDDAATMAELHADDTTAASAMVQEPRIPVDVRGVVYGTQGDRSLQGYLAEPSRPDSVADAMGLPSGEALPGLIVIHEWWGLNENIEAMTRRLAGEGYRVLAVDLYRGQVASTPNEAQAIMRQATSDPQALVENLVMAHTFLREEFNAPRVGVLGWCFGGGMALNAALALPDELNAAVIYYGRLTTDPDELATLEMPILGIFGEEDESIPVETVEAFEEVLTEAGKDVEILIYDDAGHAFANPTGNNYVAEAAEDAWDETIAFLNEQLYHAGPDEPAL